MPPLFSIANIAFFVVLLVLVFVDIEHHRLPDALTLLLGLTGLVVIFLNDRDRLWLHAAAAASGFAALRASCDRLV